MSPELLDTLLNILIFAFVGFMLYLYFSDEKS